MDFKVMRKCLDGNLSYIKNYKDINIVRDPRGYSLLHLACIGENLEMVKLLISKGTYIDKRDSEGNTPLNLLCCYSTNINILDYLLISGADVTIINNRAVSPLRNACMVDNINFIESLVKAGANPHTPKCNGITPVTYSCMKESHIPFMTFYRLGINVSKEQIYTKAIMHFLIPEVFEIIKIFRILGIENIIKILENIFYFRKELYFLLINIIKNKRSGRLVFGEISDIEKFFPVLKKYSSNYFYTMYFSK